MNSVLLVVWCWLIELLMFTGASLLYVWFGVIRIIPKIEEYQEFFATFHEVVLQLMSVLGECWLYFVLLSEVPS